MLTSHIIHLVYVVNLNDVSMMSVRPLEASCTEFQYYDFQTLGGSVYTFFICALVVLWVVNREANPTLMRLEVRFVFLLTSGVNLPKQPNNCVVRYSSAQFVANVSRIIDVILLVFFQNTVDKYRSSFCVLHTSSSEERRSGW